MDVRSTTSATIGSSRPTSAAVVLDIQCFQDNNNEYLVKEASVVEISTGTLLLHHIARAPFDRDLLLETKLRETYWLTKHCHGLDWNRGDISYHALMDKLRCCLKQRSVVYVKGLQKKEFVQRHLVTTTDSTLVIDMTDIGCNSLQGNLLSSTSIRCGRHKSDQHRCALANCINLRSWLVMTDTDSTTSCKCHCPCHNRDILDPIFESI